MQIAGGARELHLEVGFDEAPIAAAADAVAAPLFADGPLDAASVAHAHSIRRSPTQMAARLHAQVPLADLHGNRGHGNWTGRSTTPTRRLLFASCTR